jgi:hypothetical protein
VGDEHLSMRSFRRSRRKGQVDKVPDHRQQQGHDRTQTRHPTVPRFGAVVDIHARAAGRCMITRALQFTEAALVTPHTTRLSIHARPDRPDV